ncbi:endonuclease III [Methylobacterium aerolatum]|uniref:Endonuclease III n=1 Tax=Methylobacterium aerolatum TaxID=418708 RepID=A0ABU0HT61_9HYPH|nr:endonuclease III [Methylobacterium aerolatum]MDQ0445524.1 endonuclease-3 [Methylobacterium aerolatum]GJD36365.1 Endonuclease III [Methylobacterium aerolatum]
MPARKPPSPVKARGRLAPRLPVAALDGHALAAPQPVDANAVEEIFRRFREASPEPVSDLRYTNPYTLLVAVVLSAQATDKSVNLATADLFALADTPETMLALGEERVRHFIRTIGLFNTKAKNVIALSRILVERHGGAVPSTLEDLQVLPGVGAKTASVVLNIAFGVPRIAVDTHIFRVGNRIPLAVAGTTDRMQERLEAIVPEPYLLHAHHWLILHGRYVCKARKPDCPACRIRDLCRFPDRTT